MADGAPPRSNRIVLAVAVGLCAALGLGGGWLLWSGARTANQPRDCAGLSQEECALEDDIARAWAKRQVGLGSILMFLGGAMGLTLWLTERRQGATPKE